MAEWDYEVFWKETLKQIRQDLGEEEFSVWFNTLDYIRADENSVSIAVPSSFYRDQIKLRYQNHIEMTLRGLTGKDLSVLFEVIPRKMTEPGPVPGEAAEKTAPDSPKNGSGLAPAPQKPEKKARHHQLREDYTFDNYVIGENNNFAANAAIAISRNPGTAYNPYLIYGGVGLGKTHLMQAIGNYIHASSDNKIIYITAENFLNEFLQALKENKMNVFKNKFRYTDVLLIDDIHFFQEKVQVQEELFHTFNTLLDAKKQLAFTCDRPVSELKKISERLMSRFEQCLKVDLQPPKYETRCAILKTAIEGQEIQVPGEVIDLIGKNVSTNVRDLISALNKLIAYTRLMGQPITVEITQQLLRDVFASPRQANMSLDHIQRVVAEYFSLSPNDLKGKKRTQNIVFPRQLSMYIAREITEYSTTEIGQAFIRDHTTVMHACKNIEERIRSDPTLESTIETLKRMIKEYSAKS
ncbi:MAG: chromosomal replication initiator protein DnaA [Treponema sp.]|jgi:chromosomal replication initiator protein|nr:chromosomal replication initiator protein DnaA [Treponema sp.]